MVLRDVYEPTAHLIPPPHTVIEQASKSPWLCPAPLSRNILASPVRVGAGSDEFCLFHHFHFCKCPGPAYLYSLCFCVLTEHSDPRKRLRSSEVLTGLPWASLAKDLRVPSPGWGGAGNIWKLQPLLPMRCPVRCPLSSHPLLLSPIPQPEGSLPSARFRTLSSPALPSHLLFMPASPSHPPEAYAFETPKPGADTLCSQFLLSHPLPEAISTECTTGEVEEEVRWKHREPRTRRFPPHTLQQFCREVERPCLFTCFTPSTALPVGKCHLRKTIAQVTRCWRREWQPPQRETQSPALPALVPVSLRLRLSGASRPPAPSFCPLRPSSLGKSPDVRLWWSQSL